MRTMGRYSEGWRRKVLVGLLSLGAIGGFASGIASMRCHARMRRAAFEDRVADVCVRAAERAGRDDDDRGGERPHRGVEPR